MRKIILILLILIVLLSIPAAYQYSNTLLGEYSRKMAQTMLVGKQFSGIDIKNLDFKTAKLKFPDTIIWQDLTLRFFVHKNTSLKNKDFTLYTPLLRLKLFDFFHKKFLLSAYQLTITPSNTFMPDEPKSSPLPDEGIREGKLQIRFVFDFFSPNTTKGQFDGLYREIANLFHEGKTLIPIDLSGTSYFAINDNPVKAMIFTKAAQDGYYTIQVNKEFFKTMAWYQIYEMTDAEAELLSENPLKMAKLIEIMEDAKRESEKFKDIQQIPEDAYRHVLWSYLLTKEFGAEFAKRTTNAHEIGDLNNTEAEHEMDYTNNAIGREYALTNYKREEILRQVLNDPNVVRKAE